MASNTATGALSRTRGPPGGGWCSGTCCTWAKSMTRRSWRGGGRSRCSRTAPRNRGRCLCFRQDRCEGLLADAAIVHVKLSQLQLRRPRQWGACWLALLLWRELQQCQPARAPRSEEHTSELQSHSDLVCRLLLEKKNKNYIFLL